MILAPTSAPRTEPGAAQSGAPSLLDWLVTLAGVWIMTGLFIDAHQHLFMAVESFINPWHMTLYSGAVFAAGVLAVTIAVNYRRAGSFWKAVPFGYAQSVVGVAALLVGGALDALWHSFFGFEHQLDLLLSPPHLFLLTGLFFLITGPVRSSLARPEAKNLLEQLPMLVALGLAFEITQFVTQYGFYPEALMRDHPLPQADFHSEQFVLSVLLFYRQALEIAIVIWQSLCSPPPSCTYPLVNGCTLARSSSFVSPKRPGSAANCRTISRSSFWSPSHRLAQGRLGIF